MQCFLNTVNLINDFQQKHFLLCFNCSTPNNSTPTLSRHINTAGPVDTTLYCWWSSVSGCCGTRLECPSCDCSWRVNTLCVLPAAQDSLVSLYFWLAATVFGSAYRARSLSFYWLIFVRCSRSFFNVWRHLNLIHIYITLLTLWFICLQTTSVAN